MNNTTAFNSDYPFFDNCPTYSPTTIAEPVFAAFKSNSSPEDESPTPRSSSASKSRVEKRRANTLAARRYRQNRLDKIAELELALKATQLERDALKVRVAKLEGETHVLKDLVRRPHQRRGGEAF